VPDLEMFQRFLDVADYWFGYSDDSNTGRYDLSVRNMVPTLTSRKHRGLSLNGRC
jgi:hypothetical protein